MNYKAHFDQLRPMISTLTLKHSNISANLKRVIACGLGSKIQSEKYKIAEQLIDYKTLCKVKQEIDLLNKESKIVENGSLKDIFSKTPIMQRFLDQVEKSRDWDKNVFVGLDSLFTCMAKKPMEFNNSLGTYIRDMTKIVEGRHKQFPIIGSDLESRLDDDEQKKRGIRYRVPQELVEEMKMDIAACQEAFDEVKKLIEEANAAIDKADGDHYFKNFKSI